MNHLTIKPNYWLMYVEFPLALSLFILASLNLAYRSMWLITLLSALLLVAFHTYLKWRYAINMPLIALFLAFAAVEVDTLGNHFRWYQQLPWPVPYDVLAHLTIPIMLSPGLFWLIRAWFEKQSYRLPLGVIAFIAINVNFSLGSLYEITEMWDDFYFGGERIKEIYDTPRDLQFDLLGSVIGSLMVYGIVKWIESRTLHKPK